MDSKKASNICCFLVIVLALYILFQMNQKMTKLIDETPKVCKKSGQFPCRCSKEYKNNEN